MKRVEVLLFNKKTGVLIGRIDPSIDVSTLDSEKFITKVVELDVGEYYWGDYTTGKIVNSDDKPYISEKDIRFYTSADILEQYPLYKQLNIIVDMLEKSDLEKTPEFKKMLEDIKPFRERANLQLQAYQSTNAFSFYSNTQDNELVKKRYEF